MADAGKGWTLSGTFNKLVHHLLSPTMIIMMVAMVLPVVATAAPGSIATFGDILMATADMYGQMLTAPFTDGGVIVDAAGNALEGNWGAYSYEWGMMDHGGHGMEAIDHPNGHTQIDLGTTGTGAHDGHHMIDQMSEADTTNIDEMLAGDDVNSSLAQQFDASSYGVTDSALIEKFNRLNPEIQQYLIDQSQNMNMTLSEAIEQSEFCKTSPIP